MQTPAPPQKMQGSRRQQPLRPAPRRSLSAWLLPLAGPFAVTLWLGCGTQVGDEAPASTAPPLAETETLCGSGAGAAWNLVGGDVLVTPGCKKGKTPGWPVGINGRHVLFANFEGVDVRQGDNALENEGLRNPDLNAKGVIEMDMFDPNGMDRTGTILKIQKQVATWYADMNVDVVISRPLTGDYLMTVVGGKQGDIVQMSGVVGISPGDCKNNNEANLNYAFSGSLGENPEQTSVTIAHEAGHALGLGHTQNNKDIMYPSVSKVDGFLTGPAADPGPCNFMPGDVQDSHQVLIDNLGARVGRKPALDPPPMVKLIAPKDGMQMMAGSHDLTVAVQADSPLGIDHVTLSVSRSEGGKFRGNHPIAELRPPQSAAQLRLSTIGTFQITATAYDKVGNVSLAQTTVSIPAVSCAVPNDCAPGQKCEGGACLTPPLALSPAGMSNPDALRDYGTACEKSNECKGGLCAITPIGQICTHYCNTERLCAGGLECVEGICEPPTYPRTAAKAGQLGGKCTRNQDCFTGECSAATDLSTPRYCTKTCAPELGWSCPATMDCVMSDGASGSKFRCVAKPANQAGGGGDGGCMIGSGGGVARSASAPAAGASGLLMLALLGLGAGIARKRRV